MELLPDPVENISDLTLLKLSREIAYDIHPLEHILERHGITTEQWEKISNLPLFQNYLRSQLEDWHGAHNAAERVKLKSQSMIEELLPELYERAHDPRETLSAKVELVKTIGRFAGIGIGTGIDATVGDKLSVTINLGADTQLKFDKPMTQTIDMTPSATSE